MSLIITIINNVIHKKNQNDIKVYAYTAMFSTIFTKGNNFCDFLLSSLDE